MTETRGERRARLADEAREPFADHPWRDGRSITMRNAHVREGGPVVGHPMRYADSRMDSVMADVERREDTADLMEETARLQRVLAAEEAVESRRRIPRGAL